MFMVVLRRSGRWRSEYIVNFDQGEVTGLIRINVHYYENGNVGLFAGFMHHFTENILIPSKGPTINDTHPYH